MELPPYLFCLFFCLLYFFLPVFEDNDLLFWVPDVLCQHSEVVLWNLLSVEMFFWWICEGESGHPSYSSDILGLPGSFFFDTLYKKDLHNPDNHNGVITHLEPDILECIVKWALGNITMNKTSGGDGIPVELFQILKDDAVKELHSTCQQIWKTQLWLQDWKRSVFIPVPKKGNAKECSNHHTIALILHASKVMLKILQVRPQQYMNRELPDAQAGFWNSRGTRDQIANIRWITEKAREFQKNIYFCFTDYAKTFDCVDHNKLGNF